MSNLKSRAFDVWTVVGTGLVAGSLDISAAIVSTYLSFKLSPIFLLQFIASGAFGSAAFKGGLAMAAWGIGFQYLIALTWSLAFWIVLPRVVTLRRHPVIGGLAYGLFIWAVMNFVITPLCRAPKVIPNLGQTILGIAYVVFGVGLPISLLLNRHLRRPEV